MQHFSMRLRRLSPLLALSVAACIALMVLIAGEAWGAAGSDRLDSGESLSSGESLTAGGDYAV